MSRKGKVVVAMSGGVDSSVAACLLRQQGYDCLGVFMRVGAAPDEEAGACGLAPERGARPEIETGASAAATHAPRRLRHGCCSANDALDARGVAERLGIPFYALNFRKDFERIVDYFVGEYARARTPNPCVRCNIDLKFGKLLRYADAVGAEFVATGHYARVVRDAAGRPQLARSLNRAKDQSYVLFGIRREDIGRCLFPLGGMTEKAEVRRLAAELGLRVHDKPDSQEICFVPGNDYKRLLDARRPGLRQPGEIRDADGRVIGRHEGVPSYTIGQRRGLGVALGRAAYVTRLDVLTNTVTLGQYEDLLRPDLVAGEMNWLTDPPAVGEPVAASIQIRHMHAAAPGRITRLGDGRVQAEFDQAQPAVTPGQAAVFYAGDVVLGGGWIVT